MNAQVCANHTPKAKEGLRKPSPLVMFPLSPAFCSWHTGMTAMVPGSRDCGCSPCWKARQTTAVAPVFCFLITTWKYYG